MMPGTAQPESPKPQPYGDDYQALLDHVEKLHHKAMAREDAAMLAERQHHPVAMRRAKTAHRDAYLLEMRAAWLLWNETDLEPTRGVLFRSAAWLAHTCGEHLEAQHLAMMGLQGSPHPEIADELREVLEAAARARTEKRTVSHAAGTK